MIRAGWETSPPVVSRVPSPGYRSFVSDGSPRGDPVSWLLIRPGWKVVASDGVEIGRVGEVAGDDTVDIFDGLAVSSGIVGQPRYVHSAQVGEITDGVVHLSITADEAGRLGEYLEPATSAEIEPDSKGGMGETIASDVRELESKAVAPIEQREHSMNVFRRIALYFRSRV